MTPATLRKLATGVIREAEQAEKGERPEIQAGDWFNSEPNDVEPMEVHAVSVFRGERMISTPHGHIVAEGSIREIRGERNGRPFLWRQEPPTHD